MNTPSKPAVFLERASYRQRRLRDAVRLLPIFAVVLWAIPLLWGAGGLTGPSNGHALVYVFGVWVLLIGSSALIVRHLENDDAAQSNEDID
ncbi:MAG: hypothetical protein AAFQ09_06840 [Pseudomonadota bacterium]